jgi:hypothetical protein
MIEKKYAFNERYQYKILSLLVLVPKFISNYGDIIKPEYFENSIHADLCTIISDFAAKYNKKAPSRDSLETLVVDHCKKRRYDRTAPEYRDQLLRVARALYHADISDKQSVIDRALDFARVRELSICLLNATDMVSGGHDLTTEDYDKILKNFNKVRSVGSGVGTLGTETFGTLKELPKMLNNGSAYSVNKSIKTPFHSFDKSRTSKGLGPGECFYILGATGQGKSMIKNNMGLHAAIQLASQKKWVAHATLELSEMDNHIRYAANILDLTQEEIVSDQKKYAQRCSEVSLASRIFVKWFRPISTTADMIANWLEQLSGEIGTAPGLLILDYPDKLRPSHKNAFTGNLFQDGTTISDELIGILSDYNMPGVFSSQLQRAMQYSDEASMSNVSTSMGKMYNCDVCGVIKQNREEKNRGLGSIYWEKNRRGSDSFTTHFKIDYSKARVKECERPPTTLEAVNKTKKQLGNGAKRLSQFNKDDIEPEG